MVAMPDLFELVEDDSGKPTRVRLPDGREFCLTPPPEGDKPKRRKSDHPPAKWWHAKDHPVWGLAKIMVIISALTVYLTFTASKFDHTEIRAIALTLLTALGAEFGLRGRGTGGNG